MKKILISACLIGDKCRYDGKGNYNPLIEQLLEKYELIPFCSEVEGGLPTPRDPSEIQKDGTVITIKHKDVTRQYDLGAEKALNICKYLGIEIAILKENSPACGVHTIHSGSFDNRKIGGKGKTTQLLTSKGIRCLSENDIEDFLKEKN